MPFLGSVLKKAVRANLMSTRHPLTPPAWTSMITGRSPTAHGIYDFLRPVFLADGGVYLKINDFRDNHCETIWSIANRHKRRATSLNFYGMASAAGNRRLRHLRVSSRGGICSTVRIPGSSTTRSALCRTFDFRNLGMDIGEEKKMRAGPASGRARAVDRAAE